MPRLNEKVGTRRDLANPKPPNLERNIDVYCSGCDSKIGEMDVLAGPTRWKKLKKRTHCPVCGRELGPKFGMRKK